MKSREKTNDNFGKGILDELTPKQLKRLKASMKELDKGKGIPHKVVINRLRKLTRVSPAI